MLDVGEQGMNQPAALTEIVRRVVEVAHPQRIILFGSAARGTMGPHSDIDLLVVTPGPVHRRHLAQAIYRQLVGIGQPVDVIVATPEDLERHGQSPYLVYKWALDEGRVIYAAG
jgi:predicted nucleotidyltransferase